GEADGGKAGRRAAGGGEAGAAVASHESGGGEALGPRQWRGARLAGAGVNGGREAHAGRG
ncbi:unnamed protein product, partial [Urochloa humidicola]